jgi:hypothetical protein
MDRITNKRLYRIILWIILIISVLVLASLAPIITKPQYYATDDYFTYWAAGKLNLSGENPYDAQQKENLFIQESGHPSNTYPISIMLNPPWAVAMVMPFGFVDYQISRLLWLLSSIACIVVSAQVLWRLYKGNPRYRWVAWIVVIFFAPVISVLEVGQISSWILFGITGFLYFTCLEKNDWAAGASLAFVAIKPQVFYIFWLALLFWVIVQHRWIIIVSFASTLLILSMIAMAFNPHIITQYLAMVKTGYLPELATPTIGAYLRFFWLGTDKFWLQFVAPILGGIWFLFYWNKNHDTWNWLFTIPIILLVSQVTAPYTYTYDQVILIPAIILATIWITMNWKKWSTLILICIYLLINILDLVLHMRLSDFWFIWMAPALLIWYLLVKRLTEESKMISTNRTEQQLGI